MNNIFALLIILFSPKSLGYVSTIRYYNTLLRSKCGIDSVQQPLFSFLSKQWNDILTLDSSFQIFNETGHHMVESSNVKCKTVIIESSDHIYYAVTLPKDRTIDFSKIQSCVNRTDSQFHLVKQEEVEEITGFKIGQIPPFFFSKMILSIFDSSLLAHQRVTVSTGILNISVVVDPSILFRQSDALLADIIDIKSIRSRELIPIMSDANEESKNLALHSVSTLFHSPISSENSLNPLNYGTQHSNGSNSISNNGINDNEQITNWFLLHRNELPVNVKDRSEKIDLLHLVGIIATKRRVSKQLVFLNIIPPHVDDNYFLSPSSINNNEEDKVIHEYRNRLYAWNAFPLHYNDEQRTSELSTKVVSSTNITRQSNGIAIQLLLGATIIARLGQESAYKVMKNVKVGQKVYIIGQPQKNPYDTDVLDVVVHSLRLLEEVELPWVVSEDTRQDKVITGADAVDNNRYSSTGSDDGIVNKDSLSINSSEVTINNDGNIQELANNNIDSESMTYFSLDQDIKQNILLVNDIQSLKQMNDELMAWLTDDDNEDDNEKDVEEVHDIQMELEGFSSHIIADSNAIRVERVQKFSETVTKEGQEEEDEEGGSSTNKRREEDRPLLSKDIIKETNYIRKYGKQTLGTTGDLPVTNPVYRILGFDCEWQPDSRMYRLENETTFMDSDLLRLNRSPVALLQIATRRKVYLLDMVVLCQQSAGMMVDQSIASSPLSATESLLNSLLSQLMSSPIVIKVGLSPNQDIKRLVWSYPQLTSLRQFYSILDIQPLAMNAFPKVARKNLEGLSKLSNIIFGLPVNKTSQCSDWGIRPLSSEQIYYAAIDAYILTRLFDELFATSSLAAADSNTVLDPLVSNYEIKFPLMTHGTNNNQRKDVKNEDIVDAKPVNRLTVKSLLLHKFPSYNILK